MIIKRIFDITVASIGLIIFMPLLVLIAILVALDSPGGVFFRGRRVGRYGRPFYLLKFRSMMSQAPEQGPTVTSGDDPRITPLGRFLRRSKLDEVPGLINVLKGEMSLVGPRPEDPHWVAGYTRAQRDVLSVRPGVTGLAQIKYRNEETLLSGVDVEAAYPRILNDKLAIDLAYVEHHSLMLDLKIILQTMLVLIYAPKPNFLQIDLPEFPSRREKSAVGKSNFDKPP